MVGSLIESTRITGSLGELRWEGKADGPIVVYDFLTQQERVVRWGMSGRPRGAGPSGLT